MQPEERRELAGRILEARDAHRAMAPISRELPAFSLEDGYAVSGEVMRERIARGKRPIGWKIGFTNRTIWDEYGVRAPIWGPMFDSTVSALPVGVTGEVDLSRFLEPRIEPEIVFSLTRRPRPGMSADELLQCVGAVAHGFEIVQSLYPGWQFKAADSVAAFGMHACLRHGPWLRLDRPDAAVWWERLNGFEIELRRNGVSVDHGLARNVMGGPLHALRHMVDGFNPAPFGRSIEEGDIITTGTLTRAFPVAPGQTWTTSISGLPIKGLSLRFT